MLKAKKRIGKADGREVMPNGKVEAQYLPRRTDKDHGELPSG
jgi:hypothetical protein